MSKVKGVLVAVLAFAMVSPCFSNSVAIKRKKNKWVQSMEQTMSDSADKTQETSKAVNF